MMKRKSIIILLSILIISLLFRCWGGKELISYKIVDFDFYDKSYDPVFNVSSDISNSSYRIDSTNFYGMEMFFEREETGREKIGSIVNDFSVINNGYAFAKTVIAYKIINPIDSIKFITLRDFDTLHGANSCINDYFLFNDNIKYHLQPVSDSLSSCLKFIEGEQMVWIFPGFEFVLQEKPENDTIMELRVDIYFRDLTVLTKNTAQIIFE